MTSPAPVCRKCKREPGRVVPGKMKRGYYCQACWDFVESTRKAVAVERTRQWVKRNADRVREAQRVLRSTEKHKAAVHRRRVRSKYGVEPEEYQRRLVAQGGVCAICRAREMGKLGQLGVDHCHKTGKVRGLLCRRCNSALGMLRDRAELAAAAGNYLRAHEAE